MLQVSGGSAGGSKQSLERARDLDLRFLLTARGELDQSIRLPPLHLSIIVFA